VLIQANAVRIPLPDAVVQTVVTSPPYWAKRAYAGRQQAVVWPGGAFAMPGGVVRFPGDPCCAPPGLRWLVENGYREPQHAWDETLKARPNTPKRDHAVVAGVKVAQGFGETRGTEAYRATTSLTAPTMGQFCRRCGAWRGPLGHEPDPLMYVGHLILFLRECWRVLRDDGTLWLNLADSYHDGSRGDYGARRDEAGRWASGPRARPTCEGKGGCEVLPSTARPAGTWKAKAQAGIPELVKLAAQYDSWTCRSTVVWAKTNPSPESVRDRPTNTHEFVYLLVKRRRYYYDRIAIQEPTRSHSRARAGRRARLIARTGQGDAGKSWEQVAHGDGEETLAVAGIVAGRSGGTVGLMRNKWSVWRGPTAKSSVGHFAVFPEWLARTMVLAGSPLKVCATCRAPFGRVTLKERVPAMWNVVGRSAFRGDGHYRARPGGPAHRDERSLDVATCERTVGWRPTCACHRELLPRARRARKRRQQETRGDWWARAGRHAERFGWPTAAALVLDPFAGSGTTGKVALELGRRPVLLDISRRYLADFAASRAAAVQGKLFDVEVDHPGMAEYEERRDGRRSRRRQGAPATQYRMALKVEA
jgi:hypothetical protein